MRRRQLRPTPLDATAIVRRARRLRFRVKPGAVSQLAGAYHGARPGVGLTFAELRAYEPGDDVRHIDWNVTARQGRPFVRRFVEERALSLWLVVDVSASMRFGLERTTKADRAAQAAALLATAAIQNGDRVGLVLVSDRIELELPPAGGVRHLSQLVRALVATPTTSPGTKLSIGLARVRRTARRAMLVVISDFIAEEPSLTWRRAARRHDTIALRVVDPRENQLPDAGLLSLEDVERGKKLFVNSSSRRLRRSYAEIAANRTQSFQRWCANSGIQPFTMMTDSDPIVPLIELFSRRNTPRWSVTESLTPGRSLVPPRPNLGPEPWPTPSRLPILWLASAAVILLCLAGLVWRSLRRRGKDSREAQPSPDSLDATPRGRLVALSNSAKSALAAQFGATWRAKTTEELADEATLKEILGPDLHSELIEFLQGVDHLKFAPERSGRNGQALQEEYAAWGPRVAGFIARIEAKQNGRADRQPSPPNPTLSPAYHSGRRARTIGATDSPR